MERERVAKLHKFAAAQAAQKVEVAEKDAFIIFAAAQAAQKYS